MRILLEGGADACQPSSSAPGLCFSMKLAPALIFSTTRCAPSHSVRDEPDGGALTLAGVFPASPFVLKMLEKQIKTSRKGAPIRRPASVIFTSDKLYKVRIVACALPDRVNRTLLRLSSNTASTRSSGLRRRTRVSARRQCCPFSECLCRIR